MKAPTQSQMKDKQCIFTLLLLQTLFLCCHGLVPGVMDRRSALATTMTTGGLLLPTASQASTSISPVTSLSDGTPFPLCSFGLQIYDNDTAFRLTKTAIEVGYRNFFASVLAGNQRGFAKAVKDCKN